MFDLSIKNASCSSFSYSFFLVNRVSVRSYFSPYFLLKELTHMFSMDTGWKGEMLAVYLRLFSFKVFNPSNEYKKEKYIKYILYNTWLFLYLQRVSVWSCCPTFQWINSTVVLYEMSGSKTRHQKQLTTLPMVLTLTLKALSQKILNLSLCYQN